MKDTGVLCKSMKDAGVLHNKKECCWGDNILRHSRFVNVLGYKETNGLL